MHFLKKLAGILKTLYGITFSGNGQSIIKAQGGPIIVVPDDTTDTFDLSEGDRFATTLGGNRTLVVSNALVGQFFTIKFIQGGTGSYTPVGTWYAAVVWPGGSAPTFTATVGKADVFGFMLQEDETTFFGFISGQNY